MNLIGNKTKYGQIKAANFIIVKSWQEKNDIEIYSTNNERKSVIAERFIRNLTNKIY